ncbi:hypothetical protein OS493_027889 [Desmophyllum pertusum]|uniref:Uncharacterized protein n=1 Tax=Desmophyllum pertusum TaxID=174260 RepID=A0A9W9YKP3_9CNID|nr:hypothetical protein OS493_027889 [Desmophyllum pertusum]
MPLHGNDWCMDNRENHNGRESDFRKMLKPEGQEFLMLAISSLEAAERSLNNGTIEYQMLILLRDRSEIFLALFEQINKEKGKIPLLKQLLNQRCIELAAFKKERDKVSTFIRMCSLIKKVNLDELSRKTTTNVSQMLIKDLVQSTVHCGKVLPVVNFFGLSTEAKVMISSLSQLSDSILLRQFWTDNGNKALKITAQTEAQSFAYEDVVKLVCGHLQMSSCSLYRTVS